MCIKNKKILHYVSGISRPIGGIEKFLLNCYVQLKAVGYDIEILTRNFHVDSESYKMLSQAGIRIFTLEIEHLTPRTMLKFYRKTREFFSQHGSEYYAIHSHGGQDPFVIACAKRSGIKRSFVHVHSYLPKGNILISCSKKTNLFFNSIKSNCLFACSFDLGNATFWGPFKKKMKVIHNGIDLDTFKFNPETRLEVRKQLSITNDFVVGHVGRFDPSKNHEFILSVFNEVLKKELNSKLLLVGNGELLDIIKSKAKQLGIHGQVMFLGDRRDVAELLQAMDIFLFPSRTEGFGMAVIEAQAVGLPCVVSKRVIPESALITELVVAVDLSSPVTEWSKAVRKLRTVKRSSTTHQIEQSGYDVSTTVSQLIEAYNE